MTKSTLELEKSSAEILGQWYLKLRLKLSEIFPKPPVSIVFEQSHNEVFRITVFFEPKDLKEDMKNPFFIEELINHKGYIVDKEFFSKGILMIQLNILEIKTEKLICALEYFVYDVMGYLKRE